MKFCVLGGAFPQAFSYMYNYCSLNFQIDYFYENSDHIGIKISILFVMNEIWIETNNNSKNGDTIIKVSNKGRIWRKKGIIEESTYPQSLRINGKKTLIHRFIAEHFIPQTDEDIALGRDCIDHITHYPTDMNVNDVRNLRWATQKENMNFPEARENMIDSEFGRKYLEHYGCSYRENPRQYSREWMYYRYNGKCRWE